MSSWTRPSLGWPAKPLVAWSKPAADVDRRVHGDRVVAVGGVGLRDGVRADEQRVAAGAGQRAVVGAAVGGGGAAAAAVAVERRVVADVQPVVGQAALQRHELRADEDRRARRVGRVVGDDLVAPALGRRGHAACQRAVVGRLDRVGGVARLQVGEARSVADEVLQRLDVGVVVGREVDVAEHAVGDREPHLRGRVARRAHAVLAREVEVRERTRPVGGRRRGRRGGRAPQDDQHGQGKGPGGAGHGDSWGEELRAARA